MFQRGETEAHVAFRCAVLRVRLLLSLAHLPLSTSLSQPPSLSLLATNQKTPKDSIINPEAPLALRLSGQLLLGVVKIYSRKVGYLYSDCNDAVARIAASSNLGRSSGAGGEGGLDGGGGDVDLPEDERDATAVIASITLPEGTSGGDVADIVAALNAGGSVTGGGRFFGNGNGNNSALDAFAASIELGGAANFSLTGDSFLIAEEVSTLLPSSMHPGGGGGAFDPASAGGGGGGGVRFALSGREIERALSGSAGAPFDHHTFADDGDVETLRDASALPDRLPPASGLFGDDGGGAGANGNQSMATKMFTEGMEQPPPTYFDDDDDDNGGGGFGGGGADDDDDEDGYRGLTPSGLPPTPGDGANGSPALVGTAALLSAANGGRPLRRKRPRLDVSAETGAPRTQLVNIDIRRLLQDPSPLMRVVKAASAAAGFRNADEYGAALTDLLVSNAAAARARKERADRGRALLARPTFAPFMAPELFDAVVRCAPPPVAAAPRKPRNAGAAAAAAAAAAAGGDEGDLAGPSSAFDDGGYNDAGGAWAGGEDDDDEDDYVGGGGGGFGGIENDDDDGGEGEDGEERVGGAAAARGGARSAEEAGPSSAAHSAAITRRTRAALDRFQGEWGSDAARGDLAAARPASLDAVVAGATRLDAARWFFEVLVLRSRGFVDVSQSASYGDVEVRPRAMAFDEGVLGALVGGSGGGGGNGNGAVAAAAPAPAAVVAAV